jgi:thioredoxin-like negative regulator of GroEL
LKVTTIPALFLVKNGAVIAQFRGAIDAKKVEAAVKANLEN